LKRIVYLIVIVIVILLGLASRTYGHFLPDFIAENAGDVLWTIMVYFGFRFLLIRKRILTAMLFSLLFSFSIEFSQLYQAGWINEVRGTVLGALVLGKGFLMVDLFRYTVGILIGGFLDKMVIKFKQG
jgi:glycopeptide antibiotics resistance protein